ncbi:NAD(P)/FAD-dependent oxidoreductase [Aeromicrobium terrae]|uniref:NADH:ubiquinone reductase (non-electrogenic) n=1 Tax=Aeromicrobium terrae TaxID=2498846 RepID=A0A5C8NG36_9ACTN|nr:NAD(P)/FAD-dependent oxidoreductase [Aeromicrobium terrae]TXL57580.1 NAD(P)/FAD-dependent oxidoreductase [Aeromicrobium terrae]
MTTPTPVPAKRPHVVVVGGGFGGIAAVRKLKRADVDVTLIDRHTYNTFNPLLYQVATASLNPGDITWFLRAIRAKQSNVRFLKGTVTAMDHDTQTVHLEGGVEVRYDYLVIAVGVTTNFFGVPGAEEFAMPLYKRSQALAVRDKMFANLENAAINGQRRDLRIVVVGGGATGVETAGAFAELRNLDMPTTYPELDRKRVHITLVEMLPHVLGPFAPRLREYAKKSLIKRDVDLRLETAVKEVREDGVVIEREGKEEFLPAGIVVWASGVTAHSTLGDWNIPQGRGGRIETDEQRRVKGLKNVFAIGDVSLGPEQLPQLAQPAIQGGKYVAKLIKAEQKGRTVKAFRYRDKGTMATIGRASAVAEIKFMPKMTGFFAWIIWVGLHIVTLLGNRNRFATLTNLTAKYLTRNSHNAIVGETPPVIPVEPLVIEPLARDDDKRKRPATPREEWGKRAAELDQEYAKAQVSRGPSSGDDEP